MMALRAFLEGPARSEQTALAFLRSRNVFENTGEATCRKIHNGAICGSVMYEGRRGGSEAKPIWRLHHINLKNTMQLFNQFIDDVKLVHGK